MKWIIIALLSLNSYLALASLDEATLKAMEPKAGEVEASRSCFKELEKLGCGHPREGHDRFKTCSHGVLQLLSSDCRSMISSLYGAKG